MYRTLRKHRCQSIVEIGIGSLERTQRLLKMATERNGVLPRYAAIDLFDLRSDEQTDGRPLPLKEAFKQLRPKCEKLRLVPGEPNAVLRQAANELLGADVVLFTAKTFAQLTPAAWFFVPRILKDGTQAETLVQAPADAAPAANAAKLPPANRVTHVFVAETLADGKPGHRAIGVDEIKRLAESGAPRRRAA